MILVLSRRFGLRQLSRIRQRFLVRPAELTAVLSFRVERRPQLNPLLASRTRASLRIEIPAGSRALRTQEWIRGWCSLAAEPCYSSSLIFPTFNGTGKDRKRRF